MELPSSLQDLDRPEVECTHNRQDPSSTVQHTGLVEAGPDTVDEHKWSVGLGVLGEDGCEIVAASHSWSSGVAPQTSVQGCSSEGVQVRE